MSASHPAFRISIACSAVVFGAAAIAVRAAAKMSEEKSSRLGSMFNVRGIDLREKGGIVQTFWEMRGCEAGR